MTREWTDEDGRTWRIDVAAPVVDGGPYLVTFTGGAHTFRTEAPGHVAPVDLTDDHLQELLYRTTARTSSEVRKPEPGAGGS